HSAAIRETQRPLGFLASIRSRGRPHVEGRVRADGAAQWGRLHAARVRSYGDEWHSAEGFPAPVPEFRLRRGQTFAGQGRALPRRIPQWQWGTMAGAVFRGVLLTALVAQPRA